MHGAVCGAVAQWLDHATGDHVQIPLAPLGNLLVFFGRDSKSRWSLLSGVYAVGSKDPTQ